TPRSAKASPSATRRGACASPPAPWVRTSPIPDGTGGWCKCSATGALRDAAIHHVAAVRGVRAHVLGPAPFLDRLRPGVADQHRPALDLVERVVGRLALEHDRLAPPTHHHPHQPPL